MGHSSSSLPTGGVLSIGLEATTSAEVEEAVDPLPPRLGSVNVEMLSTNPSPVSEIGILAFNRYVKIKRHCTMGKEMYVLSGARPRTFKLVRCVLELYIILFRETVPYRSLCVWEGFGCLLPVSWCLTGGIARSPKWRSVGAVHQKLFALIWAIPSDADKPY